MTNPMRFGGVTEGMLSYLASRLVCGVLPAEMLPSAEFERSPLVLVVVPTPGVAESILSDLSFFVKQHSTSTGPALSSFLPWEVLPFEPLSPTAKSSIDRLTALYLMAKTEHALIVTTPEAMMEKVVSSKRLLQSALSLRTGASLNRESLIAQLDALGYTRSSLVEEPGQISVKGAVIDVFGGLMRYPNRLELFGDTVCSIREFDPASQRSRMEREEVMILPARELLFDPASEIANVLRERADELSIPERQIRLVIEAIDEGTFLPGMEQLLPLLNPALESVWNYVPEDALVVVYEEHEVLDAVSRLQSTVDERASRMEGEGVLFPPPSSRYLAADAANAALAERVTFIFNRLSEESTRIRMRPNLELKHQFIQARHAQLPFETVAKFLSENLVNGSQVAIVVSQESRERRVRDLLGSYEISCEHYPGTFADWIEEISGTPRIIMLVGTLSGGFHSLAERFLIVVDTEIFPEISPRRSAPRSRNIRRFLGTLAQLNDGDYVVHMEHGVGLYRGLREITVEGMVGDFLFLEYAEGARLFVPVEHIGKVEKFVGAEGRKPVLNRLGGTAWGKTKDKVKEAVAELAGQLVNLYAKREIAQGHSFGTVDTDDVQFADTFPFEETPDQARAIEEVLRDMERPQPMDRLVCGDVGYGKTEVALRAAFKAVNNGKQVAVLVPTTVLADQHWQTFRERFSDYPIRVACVSRFLTPAENKKTLAELAAGNLDIIIGTHRLLQRDVQFKDLGLLIIDEEHRFGVAHKEKLKRMRSEIDVLTLTATPIPRTLHMSLVGIRDLSTIETPPVDRQVVHTFLAQYHADIVREAVQRELARSGQAFYVYNRIDRIGEIAAELAQLVPEAKIAFAHGQMADGELEQIMHRFVQGEINVLVSTTIIESGLDIPNANTMIIRNADRFGLAELYQLRGRVGRSSRRAYAYLFVSDFKQLGDDARKRLEVLQALDDLGMGFRLALQDMEIRGAGNLLGKDQSGDVNLVGFETYSRILKDAVHEIQLQRDDPRAEHSPIARLVIDPEMRIGFPTHIPPFYVPDVGERLILYQRLVELRDETHGHELAAEIEDRFGRLPAEVETLVEVMIFRSLLRRAGIVAASRREDAVSLTFHPEVRLDPKVVTALVLESGGRIKLSPNSVLSVKLESGAVTKPSDLTKIITDIAGRIGALNNC